MLALITLGLPIYEAIAAIFWQSTSYVIISNFILFFERSWTKFELILVVGVFFMTFLIVGSNNVIWSHLMPYIITVAMITITHNWVSSGFKRSATKAVD